MDLATIIGMIVAFGLLLVAIGKTLPNFIDIPSILIVFGGTAGATLIAIPLKEAFGMLGVIKNAFFAKEKSDAEIIAMMVRFATKARKDGILALENETANIDDVFLTRGIQLAVDGQEPEAIENILNTEIDSIKQRHKDGADLMSIMAALAPAMGMIGTLIGLVQMLKNMSDPGSIGPAMAVALITTFYGAILANVLFIPIGTKLKRRSSKEVGSKELVTEGILSIVAGDNPRIVEQRLHAFLQPKYRETSFK